MHSTLGPPDEDGYQMVNIDWNKPPEPEKVVGEISIAPVGSPTIHSDRLSHVIYKSLGDKKIVYWNTYWNSWCETIFEASMFPKDVAQKLCEQLQNGTMEHEEVIECEDKTPFVWEWDDDRYIIVRLGRNKIRRYSSHICEFTENEYYQAKKDRMLTNISWVTNVEFATLFTEEEYRIELEKLKSEG